MSSENKLEKRNLDSYNYTDNQTLKDGQDVSQDNTITTVLEVALIAATSIGLYKSGALKPIAKPLAEFADKLARDGTDKAGIAMTTLKEWSNLKHLSPAEFEMSTQNFNAPKEPSIFRDRKSTGFYDLLEDAKDFIDTGKPNFYNVKKLINGSVEDVNLLTEMISENEAKIKDIQSNYSNSELSFRFNEMFDFEKTAAHYSESQSLQFSNKATEAFMNLMKLDKKEAQQQLKEMGYRKMTLGDIAELKEKDGKRSLHLKDEIPLDLNEGGKKELETLIRKANGFFDSANIHHRYVKNGEPTSGLKSGDWADIIIDHDIRINKEGTKVIDYRMSHKNAIGFLHSLANDFKLPVVQFNPFKTFGFDKVGRKDPLLGLINNQQYDPNITRIGKEKTIQSWLVDKFGETYKDKSVAIIAGKAYTTDDFGRLQELGDNFKLHDITYANSGYGLKSRLNATRQMAGLSLGEADKMITEEYMKFYKEKTGKDLGSFQKAKYNLGKMFDIGYQEVRVGDRDSVHMGLDSATSIDEATNKFINWMTDRPFFKTNGFEYADTEEMIQNVTRNNHKTLFGEGFASYSTPNNIQRNPRMYTTTKKGFKLHKAFKKAKDGDKDAAMKELTGFIKQFDPVNAGRKSDDTIGEYFTETSAIPLTILNQLSEGLGDSSKLFGLSVESKRSTYVLAENLLLKRALPVYLATKIPGVINYMSEPFFGSEDDDETGNRDNITKVFFRNVLKPIDIAAHKAMDLTSATKVFKFLGEMTPGSEQISELPGIHMLGLGQTEEERKEYIESGYDPVRKGRYWGSGNCVVPTQQIQTGYGKTTLAKDITINDKVITHEGVLKNVMRVISREMDSNEWCPEISLYTDIFSNITTDNHPYLCVKKKKCPSSSNNDCRPDRESINCKKEIYPNYCPSKDQWTPLWTLARDIEEGDYLAYPRIKILNKYDTINGLPANYEIGYILGAFLAEGNIHKWDKKTPRGVEFSIHEDEYKFRKNIKTILNKYFPGKTSGKKLKHNSKSYTIRNLTLATSQWFYDVLYEDNHNKHFVQNIYDFNKNFITGLLTGLFDGDGHIQINKYNGLSIWYTSARLEYCIQVRNLLFTLGIQNSITKHGKNAYRIIVTGQSALLLNSMLHLYKTENKKFTEYKMASKYQIIDEDYVYIKIKSIVKNNYFGIVYDYEIEDSHSFCSLSTIMHNTPFTGGKITYWRPNLYRRVEADVQFSDSKWGSRQEYYNNTWFPNPVNPLAPLNHFFLDRNHYDKKHYQDRPYLQTSPEGQNIPLIGPLFGATIGKVINPQQKMHMEYWKKGFAIDPEDEKASPILTTGFLNPEDRKPKKSIFPQLKLPYISFTETNVPSLISKTPKSMDNSQQDIGTYNKIESDNAEQTKNYSNSLYTSAYQAKEILSKGFMDKAGIIFQQTRILPKVNIGGIGSKSSEETVLPGSNESKSTYQFNSHGTIQNTYVPKDYDYDPTTSQYEAYSTPSGSLSIVDVPDSLNLWKINKDIQRYSLNKVFGTNQRVTIDDINGPGIPVGNDDEKIDNAFIYSIGEQFNWLGDVAGLKGFALQQFVTGHPNEDSRVIEDSGYAYSINNDFWNQNLGGFGGNLSEITRRFIPKRNNKTEYVNPIRNTMPSWIPGSSYFTDFKHGDPYCLSKDTLVLTDKGYVKAENTRIGDIILTNKGNHYPIKNIAIRPIKTNEKSYRLTISGIDKKIPLEFSENHPILTKHLFRGQPCGGKCKPYIKSYKYDCDACKSNKWDKSQIEYVKAKDIQIGDAVVFPIPVIDNPKYLLDYQYEWQNAPRSPKYIKNDSLIITKDIAWLIGLFLAEGSTAKCRGKIHRLLFALHSSETEVANRVCDILENTFGKRPYVIFRKEHDSLEVILCDAQIARIFDSIVPGNLYEKRIPKEFYYSTKENMTELLLGFMLGDGTIQRNYMIGTTVNQQLAYDLHRLSMYAGIPCQVIERNTRKSYEVCIHSFNLKNLDLSGLMHKQNKLNFNYTRTPGLLSYSDGTYIYSEIINKQEIILDYVYGFEVDIDDSFCVIGFATHNSKIENGEERLPGEGYERLHHMNDLMELNIGSSNIGYDKGHIVRHMLNLDDDKTEDARDTLSTGTKIHKRIEQNWLDAGIAIDTEMEIDDKRNGILGYYDALVHDRTSKTGKAIVDIKTTSAKNLEKYRKEGMPLDYHKRQVNYYLWATGNTDSKGYIYYVDKENLNNNYTVGFNFDQKMLEDTLKNVHEARSDIRKAVASGEIGRGDLYNNIEKFRILADTAPYSQEFKDASARLDNRDLTASEEREVSAIRDRLQQQKEPLRVYDYKFKTSNLKPETVTITKVIDNNTFLTKEYGKKHAIRFAGIRVSESNSEMYNKKQTKDEAAKAQLKHFIKPGRKVKILYDADEQNKYANDSVSSIRAVVMSKGRNVNKHMLSRNLATEKETDDSPAGVQARYTKGEIAFGSAMENLTHDVIGNIPFIGSKFMQVRSPYEQYRKREVYSKDFQSWNHPIRDILMPHIDETIANDNLGGVLGIASGAFIGSMFGRKKGFGKLIGAVVGGSITAAGKVVYVAGSTKERAWRPQRRKDQENLNEYVDTLKYVKNMRLYEQYKLKAMKENNFDVEAFMKSRKSKGIENKLKKEELTEYKKTVKLDFKHRDRYNFKYGKPKYLGDKMNKEETIKAINKELGELQGERSLTKLPKNVIKAIEFKQTADQTVYGYKAGDSLVNIMTALPKKERQYFKHFIDAPEEEKDKILRIAPSYLKRALQSVWGRHVDEKPSLQEYFQSHALPDQNWVGWDENTDMNDIKVKLVHQNKLDPGEFDIWDDGKRQADETNIPIPAINKKNSARQVQARLNSLLGHAGYNDVQTNFINSSTGDKTEFTINRDARNDVEQQIKSMQI